MNKLYKTLIFCLVAISTINVSAQDNPTSLKDISSEGPFNVKSLSWRVFAGPEMAFLLNGDNSVMKGGKLSINAGVELNKTFTKKTYGIFGLDVFSGGVERWINNDPLVKSKSSYDQYTTLEIPLGLGFNLGKNAPKGFYTNVTLVNSLTLNSLSNYTTVPLGTLEVQSNVENNTLDFYNLGGKVELGLKTKIEGNNYSSFSISAKSMFLNRFSSNSNQYTTLNIAANLGYYF